MLSIHGPEPIRSRELDTMSAFGIRHGFFTREGGVSQGIYRGLNAGIGSADNREAVNENRRRIAAWLGVEADSLATVHQTHSPDVVVIEGPTSEHRPKADAMVCRGENIALSVLTADCGPILMADGQARIIAAAHAGWRGALTGVIENTIAAMENLGASRPNIQAVVGPCIGPANYEVGPEFVENFVNADSKNESYFDSAGKDGHALFDLPRYLLNRLRKAGVSATRTGQCTYADENRFFSFRRTTHRKEPDYGRQMSAIILESS